jgi:hypothetical protein
MGPIIGPKNSFEKSLMYYAIRYKIQRYTIYWIFFIKVFLYKIDSKGVLPTGNFQLPTEFSFTQSLHACVWVIYVAWANQNLCIWYVNVVES